MKVTIYQLLPGGQLPHLVPPAYRAEVVKRACEDRFYSLLLFAHNRRDVVPSAPVRRALRRLKTPAPDGIILVGAVFTEEARALLEGERAVFVTMHRTFWTDESARMRQL